MRSLLSGGGSIAVAMGIMNIATYGFTMLAARMLGPQPYGALAGLMATLLVISVLQLGLQATGARRIAAEPEHVAADRARHPRRHLPRPRSRSACSCWLLAPVLNGCCASTASAPPRSSR